MISKEIKSALGRIVGSEHLLTDIYELIPYHTDQLGVYPPFVDLSSGEPLGKSDLASAVVRCGSAKEVSEVLKLANKMNLKIRLRGAGTGLALANRPRRNEIVLDLSRMDWIRIDEDDRFVEVGPAVRPIILNEVLGKAGYVFPVFPGSYRVCSVGGVVSVNTSGHSVDAYLGKPGDYVLGLEVVLPTGEIIETGTQAMRKPCGPDFTRIFVGGEGLFGVITNLWIRLVPRPLEEKRAMVIFPSIYDGAKAVQRMFRECVPYPRWLEIMDKGYIAKGFESLGIDDPDGAGLMIVTDGYIPGEAEEKLNRILEVCTQEKSKRIMMVDDPKEWERLLEMREYYLKLYGRSYRGASIDPKLSDVVEIIKELYELPKKVKTVDKDRLRLDAYHLFGHIGGITIHNPLISQEGLDPETRYKLEREWLNLSLDVISKYGGSYGEQGIFPHCSSWWINRYGNKCYELLKSMKRLFDPNNVLNPTNLTEKLP